MKESLINEIKQTELYSEVESLEKEYEERVVEAKLLNGKRFHVTRKKNITSGEKLLAEKLLSNYVANYEEIDAELLSSLVDSKQDEIDDWSYSLRNVNNRSTIVKKDIKEIKKQLKELGISSFRGKLL
jgi:hypothetical protein